MSATLQSETTTMVMC